jgi:hypothetical protein
MARICEAFLRAGSERYKKEGASFRIGSSGGTNKVDPRRLVESAFPTSVLLVC